MADLDLIATAASGLETLVRHELEALGYEARVASPGRIHFRGDAHAIREANLWLRCAERVLIRVAQGPATDFGLLFDLARSAPWSDWIPAEGRFPVRGRSIKSQLSSVPACQRIVKKAIVEQLRDGHHVEELPEIDGDYAIEVALLNDTATLYLDTTGVGLHKRGYRPLVGEAPLRETMAASLVTLSHWRPEQPFWDPFCGTGTMAIEAAMIGRNMAPGLNRRFACEFWPRVAGPAWEELRESAQRRALPSLPEPLLATDASEEALKVARRSAEAAGVTEDIHFQRRDFEDVSSKRDYGCLITNPPYGERIGEIEEIERLYQSMPGVLRRMKTWSHYVLTARLDFEALVGQKASKRRKLYNGRIECAFFQFHGPRKPKGKLEGGTGKLEAGSGTEDVESSGVESSDLGSPVEPLALPPLNPVTLAPPVLPPQAFGGLKPEAERQAAEFANRLAKRARHLRKWPTKRGITCYRLYDRDVPESPFAVDRYEDSVVVSEYERPHDRTPAEHADWLDLMMRTLAKTLEVPRGQVFLRRRERQRGDTQYDRLGKESETRIVNEGGLRFRVNLTDYLDTGLFLDHRQTRGMFREAAAKKRVLNLFAYTGSFSVYAAAGGATTTTTVDLSPNYLEWAGENLRLNGFEPGGTHQLVRDDSRQFVHLLPREPAFDLAIVDPPTFSNSKRIDDDWDVQRDAVPLLTALRERMSDDGIVYFSTNFRRFKLHEASLPGYAVREISRKTVPEDFRNQRIHRCWLLRATVAP